MPASEIEPFYKEIGRRIQTRRDRLGMTQEALGAKLDPPVTRASVANIEAGKQRILAHTLPQLAIGLDMNLSELIPSETPKQVASTRHVEAELAKKLGRSRGKKLTAKIKASRLEKNL